MGARRRCCCDCYFIFDPFPVDGADVAAINANWEECAGDWEIADSMLTTEDANAVISFKQMVGWPVGIFEAKIAISKIEPAMNSIGGTAQMFAYIGSDGTPCGGTGGAWRAELDIISSTVGELRLYNPSNVLVGTRSCQFDLFYTSFWMCVGWDADLDWGEVLCGSDDAAGAPIWACHEGMPTYYFALGNKLAAPNQVYYEEVGYIDQYDHDPRCPDCSIPCCCPCVEQELNRPDLTATLVKGTDPDCHVAGVDTTLECAALPGGCCVWTSPVPLTLTCELGDTIDLELSMECVGEAGYGILGNCEGYLMTVSLKRPLDAESAYCFTSPTSPNQDPVTKGIVGTCQCEPTLQLRFGPYYLWRTPAGPPYPPDPQYECQCCKEFYIDVTE